MRTRIAAKSVACRHDFNGLELREDLHNPPSTGQEDLSLSSQFKFLSPLARHNGHFSILICQCYVRTVRPPLLLENIMAHWTKRWKKLLVHFLLDFERCILSFEAIFPLGQGKHLPYISPFPLNNVFQECTQLWTTAIELSLSFPFSLAWVQFR